MTPEQWLAALRKITPEFNPWAKRPGREATGAAYARLTHAMADFVDSIRAEPDQSYDEAVKILEGLVQRFPRVETKDAETSLARLRVFLASQPSAVEPVYGKPEDGPQEVAP